MAMVNRIYKLSWNGAAQGQLAMKYDKMSQLLSYNYQKDVISDIKLTSMKA